MFKFLVRLYRSSVGTIFDSLYNDMDGVRVLRPAGGGSTISHPVVASESVLAAISEQTSQRVLNRRYIFPLLLYIVYLLDLLYLCLGNPPNWTFTGTSPSDGTIGRKLLPAAIAQEADIFWIEIVFMVLGVAGQFLVHNMAPFERKCRIIATVDEEGTLTEMKQNGKILPRLEAGAIFKLHRQARKLSELLMAMTCLFAYPFYNLNIALNWTSSAADVKAVVWNIVAMPYMIMNIYVTIGCLIFNCRYLRIRQRHQMSLLSSLIAQSNRVLAKRWRDPRLTKLGPTRLNAFYRCSYWSLSSWSQFHLTNEQLNELSQLIGGFNLFWSRYISVHFAGLTFLVTYIAFLAVKKLDATTNLFAVLVLTYFGCILFCLLLWITLECSVLVVNNKETLKLQRIFTVHTSLAGRIPRQAAIKFDHIEADSKSIERIGFKLLDSMQINSKMFELLFFYISSLFMKIVQNEL